MKFAVQLNTSPYASNAGLDAYLFILAALQAGHQIVRVFFYKDGIYHAFRNITPPDDELQFGRDWTALAQQYHIDLVVCISAAQRRGLLSVEEARRQGKLEDDLAPGFRIAGLGLWVEATLLADRTIIFA